MRSTRRMRREERETNENAAERKIKVREDM